MKFWECIDHLESGKKIFSKEEPSIKYIFLKNGELYYIPHPEYCDSHDLSDCIYFDISLDDLKMDWEIYEEPKADCKIP